MGIDSLANIRHCQLDLRFPRHDGQRILSPELYLWSQLPMHVRNSASAAVPDCRDRCVGDVRLRDGQDGEVGWHFNWDHCRL